MYNQGYTLLKLMVKSSPSNTLMKHFAVLNSTSKDLLFPSENFTNYWRFPYVMKYINDFLHRQPNLSLCAYLHMYDSWDIYIDPNGK